METVPTVHTLGEDWQWRRDRLSHGPSDTARLASQQIKVLDYLIGRYRDSPEAQWPVRIAPIIEFRLDQRVIVVHHHLWAGKVGGIKNSQEAESRVAALAQRMASHASLQEAETEVSGFLAPSAPDAGAAVGPRTWSRISARIRAGRRSFRAAFDARPARKPGLSQSMAQHLFERIVRSDDDNLPAVELLVGHQTRSALSYSLYAWRELAGSGRKNEAWQVLNRFLAEMEPTAAVAAGVRESLADSNAQVRLAALDILARVGTLEDIGMLSDLLALPLAADEHPGERAALLRTMQSISETTRAANTRDVR